MELLSNKNWSCTLILTSDSEFHLEWSWLACLLDVATQQRVGCTLATKVPALPVLDHCKAVARAQVLVVELFALAFNGFGGRANPSRSHLPLFISVMPLSSISHQYHLLQIFYHSAPQHQAL